MSRQPLKLLLVTGARPNFMKIAPLIHAIDRWNGRAKAASPTPTSDLRPLTSEVENQPTNADVVFDYRLVHTGQHYDARMSDVFFSELGIPPPDFCLDVGSGSHAAQTARVMERFEPVLLGAFAPKQEAREQKSEVRGQTPDIGSQKPPAGAASTLPDWVVVVGDVNSTVACTLVASKLGVKVAHVEAGLRSFDRTMPEEINRLLTDAISDLLLTPSEDANENLRREGVPEHKTKLVGNIMIDCLVANLERARGSDVQKRLGVEGGNFVYVTLHRPSNVDSADSLRAIMGVLTELSRRIPVLFPIHPRTRKMLGEFRIELASPPLPLPASPLPPTSSPSLHLIEPVGYHDSLCLTENARLVLTDSGGLQEESTWFRTPCLTLRPNTERPVTVTLGSNRLTTLATLAADIRQSLNPNSLRGKIPPLWDGRAAERICECLASWPGEAIVPDNVPSPGLAAVR